MQKFIFYFIFCAVSLFAIEDYAVFVKQYNTEHGELFITLRKWSDNGKVNYLLADTKTLQTMITTVESSKLISLDERFEKTNFAKALHHQNALNEASSTLKNTLFLTMDMCPSLKHGYESDFLTSLTRQNGKTPIAIAITSKWIESHEEAFKELSHNFNLEITWINHSHTHFYNPLLRDNENFMLHVSTNVQSEILELEKTLIKRGLTPSAFFRFPGLVFDKKLMRELKETYFLIPIGSHAWVAKNQKIKSGSIILIHGNKNEHQGIEMLESKLPFLIKKYTFKPLAEAFTH